MKSQQRILKDRFTEIKQDTQREIAKMSEDRRDMCQQLERGREEFAYMKAIQNSCVTDYQAQLADQKQVKYPLVKEMTEGGREQCPHIRNVLDCPT